MGSLWCGTLKITGPRSEPVSHSGEGDFATVVDFVPVTRSVFSRVTWIIFRGSAGVCRMESLQKQWSTIVTFGCIVIAALIEAWQQAAASASAHIPRLQGFWNYIPLFLLITAGIVWLATRRNKPDRSQIQVSQPTEITAGIPTLSALLGQKTNVTFDAKQFLHSHIIVL